MYAKVFRLQFYVFDIIRFRFNFGPDCSRTEYPTKPSRGKTTLGSFSFFSLANKNQKLDVNKTSSNMMTTSQQNKQSAKGEEQQQQHWEQPPPTNQCQWDFKHF